MRRLKMSGHRRRDASTPETAKNDHMYHPSMKVSTGDAPSNLVSLPPSVNAARTGADPGVERYRGVVRYRRAKSSVGAI